MEFTSPLDVFSAGVEHAYYMAFPVMLVITLSLISAEINKLILVYRDIVNKLGAHDRTLPRKAIAYLGMAFFTFGMALAKPFFVGIGVLSLPLVFVNLRELNRIDVWEKSRRDRLPKGRD